MFYNSSAVCLVYRILRKPIVAPTLTLLEPMATYGTRFFGVKFWGTSKAKALNHTMNNLSSIFIDVPLIAPL